MSHTPLHSRRRLQVVSPLAFLLGVGLGGCGEPEREYGGPLTRSEINEITEMWENNACGGADRDVYSADERNEGAESQSSCEAENLPGGWVEPRQGLVIYPTPAGREALVADRDCSQQMIVYGDIWVAFTRHPDVAQRLVSAGGTLCET